MIPHSSTDRSRSLSGGVIAGLSAGVFLTLLIVIASAAKGNDVWYGVKGAAAPFIGERAMTPGFDFGAVLLGVGLHLMISMAWGVGFTYFFYGLGRAATVAAGAAWGVVSWLGMYYVVLPIAGMAQMTHDAPMSRAIGFHVFFGLVLAAAYLAFRHEEHIAPNGRTLQPVH